MNLTYLQNISQNTQKILSQHLRIFTKIDQISLIYIEYLLGINFECLVYFTRICMRVILWESGEVYGSDIPYCALSLNCVCGLGSLNAKGRVFLKKDLFTFLCLHCLSSCVPTHQKKAPDVILGDREPPCVSWELNS